MNPKYRFHIYLNDDEGNKRAVQPNYKADIAKEYELETNQRFYRAKLSGRISFIRDDFDFIIAQPFETQYNVLIERSDDWGQTWVYEFLGKFFKTDCTINYDDKKLTVQIDPVDDYTAVLAGLDKEYDLIPLAPEINRLIIQKRPLIQVYIPGDSIVSCFLGGNYWEQDATPVTDLVALEQTYHFALCNLLKEINVTVNGSPVFASGLYAGRMTRTGSGGTERMTGNLGMSGNSDYYMWVDQVFSGNWQVSVITCQLVRASDQAVMFEFISTGSEPWDNAEFTMTAINGVGTATAEMATYRIYARYLLDVETIRNLTTYELPDDDIVGYNRNYRRAIGYAMDVAYLSTRFSSEPTEWGRADNMLYYRPPAGQFGQVFYPIARSTWRYASLWFSFALFDNFIEVEGRKRYLLRDTYPVHSVLDTLLKQFAPGITHTETPDCSLFFYAEQNPITFQKFKLFVSQKSNVINGEYTQPAQKAPATLGQFLSMLRDVYRCYWHIENGKLRIEHVSWYDNGGTYSGGDVVGIDLTQMINIRNGKDWAFSSSEVTFDKTDMPERYQFNWMDDVTKAFEGLPIEVKSKYVTPGKIEEINVSNFTSDIDMMLLNPGDMSNDGFALFAGVNTNALITPDSLFTGSEGINGLSTPRYATKSEVSGMAAIARFDVSATGSAQIGGVFFNGNTQIGTFPVGTVSGNQSFNINVTIPENTTAVAFTVVGTAHFQFFQLSVPELQELPFVQRDVDGVTYFLQNGYLAFVTLQPNYYVYDLPAYNVMINGAQSMVLGVQKKKKQEVVFPLNGEPNLTELIKTRIGNGAIEKMSLNLHSRMTKTTLKYDTE